MWTSAAHKNGRSANYTLFAIEKSKKNPPQAVGHLLLKQLLG
jgi:hypothetical protein